MKKILKSKLDINELLTPCSLENPKDGFFQGYNFVITMEVLTQATDSAPLDIVYYEHEKFLMGIESRVRSLMIILDNLLNKSFHCCTVRPLPQTFRKEF